MSLRSALMHHNEMAAARAARAFGGLAIGFWGEVANYNATDGTVQVAYAHVSDVPTVTQWIPLAVPAKGYQYGPEIGDQVLVLQLSPRGDDLVALCVTYNAVDVAPAAPATEHWMVDKRGSSVKLTADGAQAGDGQGGVKLAGAGYAFVGSDGTTEVGAQNLDDIEQAAQRFTDMKAYHAWLTSTFLPAWAAAKLQPGSGALGPDEMDPPNLGSQTVRVAD